MGLYAKQTYANQVLHGGYLNEAWCWVCINFFIFVCLFAFRLGQWWLLVGCAPGRQWTGDCSEISSWPGLSLCPFLAFSVQPSWPCSPTSFCEALKVRSASLSAHEEPPPATRIPRERWRAYLNLLSLSTFPPPSSSWWVGMKKAPFDRACDSWLHYF